MKSRTISGVMVLAMALAGTGAASGSAPPGHSVVGSVDAGAVPAVVPHPGEAARPCAEPFLAGEKPVALVPARPVTVPEPPEYYAFPLVTTKKVPSARGAKGRGRVTFAPSPFGVAVAPDGSFAYDLRVSVTGLRPPSAGTFVAWVTTRELDRIRRLGPLDDNGAVTGRVAWNKFLVVITLEADAAAVGEDGSGADGWSGPIALRGMSRSGRMHTMAGHGPFVKEKCANYGFGG